MRSTLQAILNIQLTDDAWEQATLPVANGGIGVRKATQVALPAFLSSISGSQSLITELLPGQLRHTAGTDEPAFSAAVRELEVRTNSTQIQPP